MRRNRKRLSIAQMLSRLVVETWQGTAPVALGRSQPTEGLVVETWQGTAPGLCFFMGGTARETRSHARVACEGPRPTERTAPGLCLLWVARRGTGPRPTERDRPRPMVSRTARLSYRFLRLPHVVASLPCASTATTAPPARSRTSSSLKARSQK